MADIYNFNNIDNNSNNINSRDINNSGNTNNNNNINSKKVRYPAVAGAFYPGNPTLLRDFIISRLNGADEFLKQKEINIDNKNIRAILVPHAGYTYSGSTAAKAYRLIMGNKYKRVIVLGPSHNVYLTEMASDPHEYWQTPLGSVRLADNYLNKSELAHANEHCLEVQVPFLQIAIHDFELMPILVGVDNTEKNAEKIKEYLDKNTLLVISTDLSHFHTYDYAKELDNSTINAIEELDPEKIKEACGEVPIKIMINIAKSLGLKPVMLDYMNSGDTTGDHSAVVGYGSFVFI